MTTTIYLGLGSNLGDRQAALEAACAALLPEVRVLRRSRLYETAPWGYHEQADFLNQVVAAETDLAPAELLPKLKAVEAQLGRQPRFRNGPREIDIDLLLYGDAQLRVETAAGPLQVPHPGLAERAFVLAPLADVGPALRIPGQAATAAELLAQLDSTGVRLYGDTMTSKQPLQLGEHRFVWGERSYVMGIVNVTPDSFSGDGLAAGDDPVAAAVAQAQHFVEAGADLLDVGGESTRPGSQPVSAAEEIARVVPVIRAIAAVTDTPISIDTYKAETAAAALDAGAQLINDVWGLRADPELGPLAAARGAPIILMHNRSNPAHAELRERLGGRYVGVEYANLLEDIRGELLASVALARAAGVPDEHILLDPGIGFGKTREQNLELLNRTDEICALGYPVLVGPSRKSFIGFTLDLPPEQRVEGTAAAVAVAITRGADIVRVHDVAPLVRVARMTDAITRQL